MLKRVEVRPSRAGGRSKTVPAVPTMFRVSCGNPESRQGMHGPGTLNSGGLTGNEGRSRAARCFRIVENLSFLTRNLLCSVNPEFESTADSQSQDSSLDAKTIHQFLFCLARSVSSQRILLKSSIAWQSFAWFSRKSLFLISNSPHKLIFSL